MVFPLPLLIGNFKHEPRDSPSGLVEARDLFSFGRYWTGPWSSMDIGSIPAGSLDDLHKNPVPLSSLSKRGIEDVYRSQRIQPNQYYSNFTVAVPV